MAGIVDIHLSTTLQNYQLETVSKPRLEFILMDPAFSTILFIDENGELSWWRRKAIGEEFAAYCNLVKEFFVFPFKLFYAVPLWTTVIAATLIIFWLAPEYCRKQWRSSFQCILSYKKNNILGPLETELLTLRKRSVSCSESTGWSRI